MPDTQDLSSYDFKSNPFMEVLGGGLEAAQQMPQEGGDEQAQAMAAPQQGGAPAAGGMPGMGGEEPEPNQLDRGQNPDKTKYLMGAVQQLENYIKDSTQKDEIQTARGLIVLLSRLIHQDQEAMTAQL